VTEGFAERMARSHGELRSDRLTTLQINVGKVCNQACRHCHVDASPTRTESMSDSVVEACLDFLERSPDIDTLDVTGGAPEMHPRFREIVDRSHALGRKVLVRHNLTIQFEPGQEDLPQYFADRKCEVVSSLPHYTEEATDRQRGRGVFTKSIEGIRRLNAAGYGHGNCRVLTLVANPVGAFLPPRQEDMERDARAHLLQNHGVTFDRLITLTNMPIARFAAWLDRAGLRDEYDERLQAAFNPATVPALMCRSLVSVEWDGTLHDCDFNQMLSLGLHEGLPRTIQDLQASALEGRLIRLGNHCYGCTAGAGSSCGGALT
jgi:radical SAM/Cys-rich protein